MADAPDIDAARLVVLAEAGAAKLGTEELAPADALGRILAEPVSAAENIPRFDNSAMDGFVVAPGPAGRRLRVVGESRAGTPSDRPHDPASALRISTGAAMPEGGEAVIQVEQTTPDGDAILLHQEVTPGMNVRRAGEDMRAGGVVLDPGTVLGAAELAVAAGAGRATLTCARRPRVAVIATGDELRPPGAELGPGQIHDTNSLAIAALASSFGATPELVERVADDRAATAELLERALSCADLIAVCGGVSVGPHDHVKPALAALGVEERFWGVDIRPGRPTWFGSRRNKIVLGLPGNPVSAMVIFTLLGRPAIAALQGAAKPVPPRLTAVTTAELRRSAARDEAVRVRLATSSDGLLEASSTGPQGSHVTTSLIGADALALVRRGDGPLPAGSPVEVELL